jgi:hypothetical protein
VIVDSIVIDRLLLRRVYMSQVKWLARQVQDLCGEAGPHVDGGEDGQQKTQAGVGATTSLYLFHFLFLLYMYLHRFVSGPMYFSSFVK